MHLKISSAQWRPFYPGGDELKVPSRHRKGCLLYPTTNTVTKYAISNWPLNEPPTIFRPHWGFIFPQIVTELVDRNDIIRKKRDEIIYFFCIKQHYRWVTTYEIFQIFVIWQYMKWLRFISATLIKTIDNHMWNKTYDNIKAIQKAMDNPSNTFYAMQFKWIDLLFTTWSSISMPRQ